MNQLFGLQHRRSENYHLQQHIPKTLTLHDASSFLYSLFLSSLAARKCALRLAFIQRSVIVATATTVVVARGVTTSVAARTAA